MVRFREPSHAGEPSRLCSPFLVPASSLGDRVLDPSPERVPEQRVGEMDEVGRARPQALDGDLLLGAG